MLLLANCWVFLTVISAGFGQVLQLPALNVYPQWLTLSGFSSGGSFAQQVQISYSSVFSGIAVFSHTYYRCGPPTGIQQDYDNVCTTLGNRTDPDLYDTNEVLRDIQNYYDQDLIDNPINLRNKRLYVFAGTRNPLFTTDMSLRILQVYEPLIQNTEAVKTRVMEAHLLLPTVNFGAPCQESAEANLFLGSCGISGAYEALHFLLGDVVKKPPRNGGVRLQPLLEFDQTEFLYGFTGRSDMDTVGFFYVPSRCVHIKCLFHFYFHGCNTGREFNGTRHIVNSGYMEVAELSNIIMVFPQAVSSEGNEIGCWDTYGFTGLQYATKRGHQVTVIRNILARVLGEDAPGGKGGLGQGGNGLDGLGQGSAGQGVISEGGQGGFSPSGPGLGGIGQGGLTPGGTTLVGFGQGATGQGGFSQGGNGLIGFGQGGLTPGGTTLVGFGQGSQGGFRPSGIGQGASDQGGFSQGEIGQGGFSQVGFHPSGIDHSVIAEGVGGNGLIGQGSSSSVATPNGFYLPPNSQIDAGLEIGNSVSSTSANPFTDEITTLRQQVTANPDVFENTYLPPKRQRLDSRYPTYPDRRYRVDQSSDGSLYAVPTSPTSYYTSVQSFKK